MAWRLSSFIGQLSIKTRPQQVLIDTKEDILKKHLQKLHQIPVVDDENRVVGIKEIEELVSPAIKPNKVVLMVGGLGTGLDL